MCKADKRLSRTWQGMMLHPRVGTSSLSLASDCGDIRVAFYIIIVCQLLRRVCALSKMGMSAL